MLKIIPDKLRQHLVSLHSVVVAFSGGVDSTVLLKSAMEVLGPNHILAVTATSEIYPPAETEYARKMAQLIGARHLMIETHEMTDRNFLQNPPNRCYHCKKSLFNTLKAIASEHGIHYVVDGSNSDDLSDFRPGAKAAHELGVISPLQDANLSKNSVRKLAKKLGLPNWNKPGMPCLSTRVPYGHTITVEKLLQINKAEEFFRSIGIEELRIRHHDTLARIEVPLRDIPKIVSNDLRAKIVHKLEQLGFNYVSIDLKGFRSGSFNETLAEDSLNG